MIYDDLSFWFTWPLIALELDCVLKIGYITSLLVLCWSDSSFWIDRGMYHVSGHNGLILYCAGQFMGYYCKLSPRACCSSFIPSFPETLGGIANSLFAHPGVNPCHALQ